MGWIILEIILKTWRQKTHIRQRAESTAPSAARAWSCRPTPWSVGRRARAQISEGAAIAAEQERDPPERGTVYRIGRHRSSRQAGRIIAFPAEGARAVANTSQHTALVRRVGRGLIRLFAVLLHALTGLVAFGAGLAVEPIVWLPLLAGRSPSAMPQASCSRSSSLISPVSPAPKARRRSSNCGIRRFWCASAPTA
jgi:hypothetical protein